LLQKIRRVHCAHACVGGQRQVCRRNEAQLAVVVPEASRLLDRGHALGRAIDAADDAPEKGGRLCNRVRHPDDRRSRDDVRQPTFTKVEGLASSGRVG
jgi:hypothetical protein